MLASDLRAKIVNVTSEEMSDMPMVFEHSGISATIRAATGQIRRDRTRLAARGDCV
jgi:hypothetical protein